jgi:hypothetical protein
MRPSCACFGATSFAGATMASLLVSLSWPDAPWRVPVIAAGYGVAAAFSGTFVPRRNVCTTCVNFSCPMNAVPGELKKAYFERNPGLAAAWKSMGYRLSVPRDQRANDRR